MRTYTTLAAIALCSSCASALVERSPNAETEEAASLAEELSEARRTPDQLLLLGTEYESRPAPTLDETQERLRPGGAPSVLLQALMQSGLSEQEALEMTHVTAAHNSGQPYDRVRIRADQWREAMEDAVNEFRDELEAAEAEQGVNIDRGELARQGVVLTFGEEAVR